ncbi:helix-turn-helix transcriptional regulator [Dactylosporangium sp. CA-233914]|uniref:helix-turn-helix transcriptional regulator n=1 Tax=Dactylosporangium sp. CA-233914 TaxID=3239934 RepID=UPI003D8A1930
MIGRLTLFLGCLARALASDDADPAGLTNGVSHPAVLRAMQLLEAAPARAWTLADLAAGLHLTRGYLVRLFKAATGMQPMAYLSRFRIEMAAGMLLRTGDLVTHIGETVGWPDANNFARRFKAHYGLSASTYRSRFSDSFTRLRGLQTALREDDHVVGRRHSGTR